MSKILAEQLLAGIILADNDNREYIYLPGGEVGSEDPHCVFEKTVSAPATCRLKKRWNLPNACTLPPANTPYWETGRIEEKYIFIN